MTSASATTTTEGHVPPEGFHTGDRQKAPKIARQPALEAMEADLP